MTDSGSGSVKLLSMVLEIRDGSAKTATVYLTGSYDTDGGDGTFHNAYTLNLKAAGAVYPQKIPDSVSKALS